MAGIFGRNMPNGMPLPNYDDIAEEQAGYMGQPVTGMFGKGPSLAAHEALHQSAPAQPQKSSFFGQGGTGRAIAGYLGDALLTASGARPMYTPIMAQRQQEQRENAEWQRRFMLQQMAKGNPTPTTMQRDFQWFQTLSPAEKVEALKYRRSGAPALFTDQSGNTFDMLGGGGEAAPGPQPGAVEDGYVFLGGDPANPASWRKQ